jgi:hypothetical protein
LRSRDLIPPDQVGPSSIGNSGHEHQLLNRDADILTHLQNVFSHSHYGRLAVGRTKPAPDKECLRVEVDLIVDSDRRKDAVLARPKVSPAVDDDHAVKLLGNIKTPLPEPRGAFLDTAAPAAAEATGTAAKWVVVIVVASSTSTSAAEPWQTAWADRVPSSAWWCVVGIAAGAELVVATMRTGEERVVKGGMHTPAHAAAGSRQAPAADEGTAQRIVGAETGWVEVVVADVEGRGVHGVPACAAAGRTVDLVLVLEAWRWEVACRWPVGVAWDVG